MKKGRAGQFKVRTNGTVVCIRCILKLMWQTYSV